MPRDLSSLANELTLVMAPQYRGRLLSRGQAQSMIRRDGILPDEAPQFGEFLDEDLLGYGYALMSTSLRIMDLLDVGDAIENSSELSVLARKGFFQASHAIEAATRNASGNPDLAFHRLIAGVASHLGGYAARAYSLVNASRSTGHLTSMEHVLVDLILRDLEDIEIRTRALKTSPTITDEAILATLLESNHDQLRGVQLLDENSIPSSPIDLLLAENYMGAVAKALYALSVDPSDLLAEALENLERGQQASQEINAPGPWWVYRLTRWLLEDLAKTSIRKHIPQNIPLPDISTWSTVSQGHFGDWKYLRNTFIESLLTRSRSEIDLWPSQLQVVDRIFTTIDDLVIALPTSAGKTRIAELCILACLGQQRRIVYVTPLRALSAQTEQVLDRTFGPLGIQVSALYGSAGVSNVDTNALRNSQIVVATPEKLDFALRTDPTLLDDVGLVVLDEGHMIGPSAREVRYEAQIQRLLRRSDATDRRIVCLSAVFPSGNDLDDFVAWITQDSANGLHRENWRPTQQRFGIVEWREDHARLSMTMGEDRPFIPRYLEARAPIGPRRKAFPSDQRELSIATAWRLIEEGQTVLIFCPQRNSVEPYAREVIKLHQQGLIDSVLPAGVDLANALAVGAEWFGEGHPILECLRLGVAIHHGALPGSFRREVENLLKSGDLKLTVASPTLAQGLNLSASVVLFHGLRRGKELLNGAEFSNVIGRAGRAYVDTEGLVLYPIFESNSYRRRDWHVLTSGVGNKSLRSGLIEIGNALITRVIQSIGTDDLQQFLNYVTGDSTWSLPMILDELDSHNQNAEKRWRSNLALLDTGILSIIGDNESGQDHVTELVVEALRDSLWDRQLKRLDLERAIKLREVVASRTQFIWRSSTPAQRRGWYLAGLGVDAGIELAQVANNVVALVAGAEAALVANNHEMAAILIVQVATILLSLTPFQPEVFIENWQEVLIHWISGRPLADLEIPPSLDPVDVAQFIESALIYRLVWGMEAARVYEAAQAGASSAIQLTGSALTVVETGTYLAPASILIRSGFDHRSAAIEAVMKTGATFDSSASMKEWIRALDPYLTNSTEWPTPESHSAWNQFVGGAMQNRNRRWRFKKHEVNNVHWFAGIPPENVWLRVTRASRGRIELWSPSFERLGQANFRLNPDATGTLYARIRRGGPGIEIRYRGPSDLFDTD